MNFILSKKVYYILRVAVAMCFIGHGSFGIITKPIWCNYFFVFGIEHDLAYQLMPAVGAMDIALGIIMLIYPVRVVPLWLIFWGTLTALLRPLSGEPFAEFIERTGNFGAPLALLMLSGFPKNTSSLFSRIGSDIRTDTRTFANPVICLRVVVFLLMIGHGWLNIIEKKALLSQYASLGFSNPDQVAQIIGITEIIAAFIVLIKPVPKFLFILFIWKMVIELFYPHYGLFEWIERGGSYGVLLALWLLTEKSSSFKFISSNQLLLARKNNL